MIWGRERARRTSTANEAFLAAAEAGGWTVVPPAKVAAELGPLATRKPARLVMVRRADAGDFWFTWHLWVTHHPYGHAATRQNHRSRFVAALPNSPTDGLIVVRPRSRFSGALKRVRGMGTGDAEFDRRFMVTPVHDPIAVAIATPAVREALLSGFIPPFSLYGKFALLTYEWPPWPNILAEGTRAITALADLLRSGA